MQRIVLHTLTKITFSFVNTHSPSTISKERRIAVNEIHYVIVAVLFFCSLIVEKKAAFAGGYTATVHVTYQVFHIIICVGAFQDTHLTCSKSFPTRYSKLSFNVYFMKE